MKVIVVLLLVTLARCQYERDPDTYLFEEMAERMAYYKEMLNWGLENMVLDSSTDSGYNATIESMLSLAEDHLCFNTDVVECDSTENNVLGCNCVSGFLEQGECADVPCRLFGLASEGATALRELVDATTAEDIGRWIGEKIYIPLTNIICDCPGVFGATVNCAVNYDGQIFYYIPEAEAGFRSTVGQLELGALQKVLERVIGGSCGDIDGTNCYEELAGHFVSMGQFIDNSINPSYDPTLCHSLKKYEKLYETYLSSYYQEPEDLKKYINGIVNNYVKLERAALCDADCAQHISDKYYGCCAKRAMEIFASEDVKKNVAKVIKNFVKVLGDVEKFPNIKGATAKYYSIFDLEKFCGPDISAYRVVNENCEAIEA